MKLVVICLLMMAVSIFSASVHEHKLEALRLRQRKFRAQQLNSDDHTPALPAQEPATDVFVEKHSKTDEEDSRSKRNSDTEGESASNAKSEKRESSPVFDGKKETKHSEGELRSTKKPERKLAVKPGSKPEAKPERKPEHKPEHNSKGKANNHKVTKSSVVRTVRKSGHKLYESESKSDYHHNNNKGKVQKHDNHHSSEHKHKQEHETHYKSKHKPHHNGRFSKPTNKPTVEGEKAKNPSSSTNKPDAMDDKPTIGIKEYTTIKEESPMNPTTESTNKPTGN